MSIQQYMVKEFGPHCRIIAIHNGRIIRKTNVLYKSKSDKFWKVSLGLDFIMKQKSISVSSCFGNGDYELMLLIAQAQAEAFRIHGSDLCSDVFVGYRCGDKLNA
ncbi:hypothetical protein VmeM32_00032 [Vibrio phage vB_VmeM-32]|nr:hypothetical protein VmeM32_00032 [Vibrio phage vB_VmeM-32]